MNIKYFLPLGLILSIASFCVQWTVPQVRAQTGNQSDVTGAIVTGSDITGGAFSVSGTSGVKILARDRDGRIILSRGKVNDLEANLIKKAGVSAKDAQELVVALKKLMVAKTSSRLDVNLVSLVSKQKSLNSNLLISQSEETETISVDIRELNAAIEAYNNIISQSSPEVLQKLAKIPEFLQVRDLLKELTSAVEAELKNEGN